MPMSLTLMSAQFAELGIATIEYALTADDLAAFEAAFPILDRRIAGARASDFTPEARAMFAEHKALLKTAEVLGGAPVRLSRLLAFDKSPETNWFVPWHQDRAEDGVDRPVDILERTLALRIHLDDCDEDNGPLEVLPGTHTLGRIEAADIANKAASKQSVVCLADRGDIVAMRPLLVHRSQRAKIPRARRVLHLEYTAFKASAQPS
jgi:hypothetical protein